MAAKGVPLHPLGKNGPLVSAVGLGLMNMSSHAPYGAIPSDEERLALLDRAYELGITFWDSSDLYGDSEELLNKWFKQTGERDKIFLATKFGYVKGSKSLEINTSYEYTKKACAESLERLGVDSIDLYYVHNVNAETPIEETMKALAELKAEGKIKHIGLSTISSATLRRAVKVAPVTAMQVEYSPFTRDVEGARGTHLLAACRELGIAVVVACPLGRGILTSNFSEGKNPSGDEVDPRERTFPRFMPDNRAHNVAVVARFRAIADRKGCSVSQLALAWLLKQGADVFPIPGTKRASSLEDNAGAAAVVLTDAEEKEIRELASTSELAGWVVPPPFEGFLYRDTKEVSS